MKKHTCHLDLHQRSHYVTTGQRNWVRKLFNNQKVNLFDNKKEKLFDKPSFSNQPNQLQIQFVIDQGDLMTCKMKEKRPVLKRSMLILLTKNSVLQIEQGDLLKQRKFKHVHLKIARVSMLSRLMIEQSDLLLTKMQYKTTLKYIMRPERSTLTMKHFVKEWRQTWTSNFLGLPHSIVKHAQSTSVRQLIQKIENHPNRHTLQRDLRQNQSFNPFSPESKQVIQDVGNIELCELLETEPKTQCKVCLSYWDIGILYCTCGHFLRKGRGKIRNSSSIRWTFFQFQSMSSRKDDLTDIDVVRSRETNNIIWPTSWRRNARRNSSRASMIDSHEMKHSAIE